MKERERAILNYIVSNEKVSLDDILSTFSISRRTLYYDIENINFFTKSYGQVKSIDKQYVYVGEALDLESLMQDSGELVLDKEQRRNYILYQILQEKIVTQDEIETLIDVSKNTALLVMKDIKEYLEVQGLTLQKDDLYRVYGDELQIRTLFLLLIQEDNNIWNEQHSAASMFDAKYDLQLTDYARLSFGKFIEFITLRTKKGNHLTNDQIYRSAKEFPYYKGMKELIPYGDTSDYLYMSAYVASLSSTKPVVDILLIQLYTKILIERFEASSAVAINDRKEFEKKLGRHLQTSYYRIRYHFPVINPLLDEIKEQHSLLFRIIHRILEDVDDFPEFKGMREEEIAYIVSYFGGYLKGMDKQTHFKNRVLLVCPHGLMTSKSLEVQLHMYLPMIEIVDIVQLKEIDNYKGTYDYMISTIVLKDYPDCIVVSPLLTVMDVQYIANKLMLFPIMNAAPLDYILNEIEKYATIHDKKSLEKSLSNLMNVKKTENRRKEELPMLKDLLSESRTQHITSLKSWEEAIQVASQPLLDEKCIEPSYVDAMIASVKEHGPYIVLADEFALPHASSASGVHELSMSLLVLDEPVDLLGKPVRLWMVLASVDNSSHMRALANLSQIFYESENMEILFSGDAKRIMKLVKDVGGEA